MSVAVIGQSPVRVDGRSKVTGAARYAADFNQPNQAHGVIVGATIGLGRITAVAARAVRSMPGVLAVLTHENAPRLPYRPHKAVIDPAVGERLHVLQDDRVRFHGQPVAVIVAETIDQAECAANALSIDYAPEPPVIDPAHPEARAVVPEAARRSGASIHADSSRGDADAALASAALRVDAVFEIARENHNPMEPHATIAAWQDGRLTLWSKSQYVGNEQAEIAAIFGLPLDRVQVICPFVGGGFGTSLRTWSHVTLAALAAREVGRPVKLVLTRKQMFSMTGHRPRTRQRIALGATEARRLTNLIHEGIGETSRYEEFIEALTVATPMMVSCSNVRTSYRIVPLDTGSPNHMRGPGEASGLFALECAMDELAATVGIDPIELRRRNEPSIDEETGQPFSSRSLLACYDAGAARFGWARRSPAPRSMREGRLLVGMGVASATYPTYHAPSDARARLLPDGSVEIEAATSDMGPGTYTALSQVAADTLGVPIKRVRVRIGQSDYPTAPSHGGSWTMASVGSAVRAACLAAQREAAARVVADRRSPLFGADPAELVWSEGTLRQPGRPGPGLGFPEILADGIAVEAQVSASRDPAVANRYSMHAFGAVFAEVAIDPDLGMIRVRRVVGAYAAGRIVNPRLASSQCSGGIVGGIGMALMERTVLDPRDGRLVNAHMADYLVPVHLDIGPIDVLLVEENDPHVNPLGVKGLGEIALVGTAPAIANAVHHATGKRVRSLPIRIEDVLAH